MDILKAFVDKHKVFFLFLFGYLFIRLFLINVNYTEWGDSFRMIRGAEYLSRGSWPWDEKRWPLYSLLLVPGIWLNAPVLWGRVLSILASCGSLLLIYLFYFKYISPSKKFALFAAMFTATSSVFAYWSLRVMADPVFVFLVLLYSYLFLGAYSKRKAVSPSQKILLTILLLMLTMTRLEGVFMAASTGLVLLVKRYWKDIAIFFIPQVLIYLPWTIYAKFLYSGPVQNDYLNEVQTFVFDLSRFQYFLTYTLFILVMPVLTYFIFRFSKSLLYRTGANAAFFVVYFFILFEIVIGFIWTPSLPRIYMPIIPFLMMFAVYGLERLYDLSENQLISIRNKFLLSNFVLIALFGYLQFSQKLYFLGASKVLYAVIVLTAIDMTLTLLFPKWMKKILIGYLLVVNILISYVVISNQRFEYKTVKEGLDYAINSGVGEVAYSDETGNSEWYLRKNGVYLDQKATLPEDQYAYLKDSGAELLLWTNEFNRGSSFSDPNDDPRYTLLVEFKQPVRDPLEIIFDQLGILDDQGYTVHIARVYLIN